MNRAITSATALALFATLSTACGAAVAPNDTDAGRDAIATDARVTETGCAARVPVAHRASAAACPSERPPASCDPGGSPAPNECRADSDCTMGTNGRCTGNPHDGCNCTYDRCTADSDCTAGGPCACRVSSRGGSGSNVCMPGNCRTDGDCGPCGFCSPTLGACGDYTGVQGFYCHTPEDECTDDADCETVLDGGFLGQRPYCRYDPMRAHWRCANDGCAG